MSTRQMKDNDKRAPDKPVEDSSNNESDLPPLVDDITVKPDLETLCEYLDHFEEEWDEPDVASREEDSQEALSSILEIKEGSWLDDGKPEREPEGIGLDDENEDNWSEHSSQGPSTMDDNWFAEETEDSVLLDDGGDGPLINDDVLIDNSNWEKLDDWEMSPEEPIEATMERLGIFISQSENELDDPDFYVGTDAVLEARFLGPKHDSVCAVSVHGDVQVAVGDGLFTQGADGMFHRLISTEDVSGTTICSQGNLTFVGTNNKGALVMYGSEPQLNPVNGWNALGLGNNPGPAVTTPFHVAGQTLTNGDYRLIGRTSGGQIFRSLDLGLTWVGPLTHERCLVQTIIEGTDEVLVFVESVDGAKLLKSHDLKNWLEIDIPKELRDCIRQDNAVVAADSKTIVIAVNNPEISLYCSLDGGKNWQTSDLIKGACAVALDSDAPGFIVTATHYPDQDRSLIRTTRDGGHNWKNIFVTGKQGAEASSGPFEERYQLGKVHQIVIKTGVRQEIFVVAGEGVHHLLLSIRDASH